jgi:hypothetical protein
MDKLAAEGNPDAQMGMGFLYATGTQCRYQCCGAGAERSRIIFMEPELEPEP